MLLTVQKCEIMWFYFLFLSDRSLFFCASFHKMAADFLRRNTTDFCRETGVVR